MPLENFLLSLHIIGAIVGLGPTFVFPLIGILGKQEGAPTLWFLRLGSMIEKRLLLPVTILILPATGAGLILASDGLWDPFIKQNRWLLAAIILYIATFVLSMAVQTPNMHKAHEMAEAGSFGPAFGALMQKSAKVGMVLTALTLTIAVLMITKPGSGFIHP